MFYRISPLIVLTVIIALATTVFSADPESALRKNKPHTGDELVDNVSNVPIKGGTITDSPGEIVGTTQYDYQTPGSTGNKCAADIEGGVHFVWMGGYVDPPMRNVYYNFKDEHGNWSFPDDGIWVYYDNDASFPQLALISDGRAAIAFHCSSCPHNVILANDAFRGFGIFELYDAPDNLEYSCYWPYIAMDRSDRTHLVMRENREGYNFGALGYTRSADGGVYWTDLVAVDTINTISQHITASPVSDKVAIAYCHPIDLDIPWENDIYFIESANGNYWDWENGKINVTEYVAGGDALFAFNDLAAIYDYEDNLHIIWSAQYVGEGWEGDTTFLYHYEHRTGAVTPMNAVEFDSESDCEMGGWSSAICKMSLGVHEQTDGIFAAYTVFDDADCSAGGYANGEVFMQYSTDSGLSWSDPENLTNSPTPGCFPGECDSDTWPSLADRVDEDLHIMYINDKDAGIGLFDEGVIFDNPVLYLSVPNPLLGGGAGNISGVVATSGEGRFGVPVDLEESGGLPYGTTATDETGAYEFLDVPDGDYTISISAPLGYYAENGSLEIEMDGQDITVDFELTTVETIDERRGVGFWKHQLYTYILGTGRARIPMGEFLEHLGNIDSHFNNNPVNPITLYTVDQPAEPMDSLMVASDLLSVRGHAPMSERAGKHLMALLLNVVSLRIHQQTAVSEDGATASQAITYCYDLIIDEDFFNDETAKEIVEQINDNIMISADVIPLSTPNISYRPISPDNENMPSTLGFLECYPNPFNATTTLQYSLLRSSGVTIEIYNIIGQRVTTIVEGIQQAGEHSITWNASGFPSGVYFVRLQAGNHSQSMKMVLLK